MQYTEHTARVAQVAQYSAAQGGLPDRTKKGLAERGDIWLDKDAPALDYQSAVEHPGGGGKPQEIDGKGGENPSLCRNRVAAAGRWLLSRNASPASSPDPWGGDAPPRVPAKQYDTTNTRTPGECLTSHCACRDTGRRVPRSSSGRRSKRRNAGHHGVGACRQRPGL